MAKNITMPVIVLLSLSLLASVLLLVRSMRVSKDMIAIAGHQQKMIKADLAALTAAKAEIASLHKEVKGLEAAKRENNSLREEIADLYKDMQEDQESLTEVIEMQAKVINVLNTDIAVTRIENIELRRRLSIKKKPISTQEVIPMPIPQQYRQEGSFAWISGETSSEQYRILPVQ